MKTCSKCKKTLSTIEFNKKHKGLQPYCRECQRKKSRDYYTSNREHHLKVVSANQKRYRDEAKQEICEYLKQHHCIDCGEEDIQVLEFDHVSSDKKENVSQLISWGWKAVQKEISKCEVVCANCHRRRTAKRAGNFYKSLFLASEALTR